MPPRPRTQTAGRPRRDRNDRRTNTGGPPTEHDVADARALLQALHGEAANLSDAFRDAAPWDHHSPGYDPDRIIRILTALQTLIPEQIAFWENKISPSTARQMWKSFLFSDHCRACALRCHTCHTLADALGYERVGGQRAWRRRTENPDTPTAATDNSPPQALPPT
ncbi:MULTISPECIES: hypothetical protein [Protofrankia]|uniref:hypothetical protein n=1 Tax=Protofrankia TaxID=2994361 RepID=UPI00069A8F9A|nr:MULTISPECIES: hypothetical protein [Protofrankia]ONH34197.1 hypothetical protein BL254_17540 [Protofrankia sp. BMG5.30]